MFVLNYYFSPKTYVKTIQYYFNSLDSQLNLHSVRVIVLWGFNIPAQWINGFLQVNSHCYTKIKSDTIQGWFKTSGFNAKINWRWGGAV